MSLSKRVKDGVKKAAKFISDFEHNTAVFAHEKGVKYVVCGHIHEPCIKDINIEGETIHYLNSGDWVENLSALEYNLGEWNLIHYKDLAITFSEDDLDITDFNIQSIINKAM